MKSEFSQHQQYLTELEKRVRLVHPVKAGPDSPYGVIDKDPDSVRYMDVDELKKAMSEKDISKLVVVAVKDNNPIKFYPDFIHKTKDGRLIARPEIAEELREWLANG